MNARLQIAIAILPVIVKRRVWNEEFQCEYLTPRQAAQTALDYADALISEATEEGGAK